MDPSQEALIAAVGAVASGGSQAIDQFPALLPSYPNVPYLHYAYGLALSKIGRNQEAAAAMHRETSISPDSPLPWIALSRIDLRINQLEDARSAAQKAVKIDPNNQQAHELLAQCLDAAGDSQDAIAQHALAAELNEAQEKPEQRIVLRYGNTAGATATNPPSDSELCNKAMQGYGGSQFAAAIPDLKSCLRQNPSNGTGWAVLGLSEYALQDYDNSLIHLDRGHSLGLSGSPTSLRLAQYTFGILLIRAGEFDRGADAILSAAKLLQPLRSPSTRSITPWDWRYSGAPNSPVAHHPTSRRHPRGRQNPTAAPQQRIRRSFPPLQSAAATLPQLPFSPLCLRNGATRHVGV